MNRQILRVAIYRFRATFRQRVGGYLGVAVLIGLVGGIAMASVAGARRTQQSFPRFLASTNPSDLTMSSYGTGSNSDATGYSPVLADQIAHVAGVKRVESWVGLGAAFLNPDGGPNFNAGTAKLNLSGSLDGLLFTQDRATAVKGRMANPARPNEFVTTATGARLAGLRLGQVVPVGFYSNENANTPGFGTAQVQPHLRVDMKLVGLVVFNDAVVQDDTDRFPIKVAFTPALTRLILGSDAVQGTWYGMQLVRGSRGVPAVEKALLGLLPPGSVYNFRDASLSEASVERAVKPEAIALGVFGAIAAAVALALSVQAISRQLHHDDEGLEVLRALGASPATTSLDGLIGVAGSVVVGSLVACCVAVGLSPLSPLGPIRPIYPSGGIAFDWTVLGVGLVVLICGLGAIAVILALRGAPHRAARRSATAPARTSRVVRAAASSGWSAPGVIGVRFALEPGHGRSSVPVRSALLGTVLAVIVVVATLTFGSGLDNLVSHPPLYGWNWSYALTSINNVPPQALTLLGQDPNVAAWTGVNDITLQIDGENIPVLLGDANAAISPPILKGHAVAAKNQIVLGAATLARLHKHVGDTVVVSYKTPIDAPLFIPPTRLVVAGTATLPAVAASATFADHITMGTGAMVPIDVLPAGLQEAISNPDPTLNGPTLVFVKLRQRVTAAAGLADMQRIADAGDKAFAADPGAVGDTVAVLPVQRPAEIVNYRSTGATPVVLAAGLAAGAIAALGLTLTASVRRRKRDLALLKTLGFTRRQLAATVAWQASVAAVIGVVVGAPLGIAAGRWLWTLFARQIYVVPRPTIPLTSVVLVAFGAIVLANVVAALPGRAAGRTPPALVLRAE